MQSSISSFVKIPDKTRRRPCLGYSSYVLHNAKEKNCSAPSANDRLEFESSFEKGYHEQTEFWTADRFQQGFEHARLSLCVGPMHERLM